MNRAQKQKCTLFFTSFCWRPVFWLNPHVRIQTKEGKQVSWEQTQGSFVIMNHTSYLDVFVFVCSCPVKVLMGVRTLMNYKLFNLPVFGSLCKMIGHYPVYFKAETHGSFSVDQEKMAPVMEDAANHLTSGGTLSVFPEGQISKDPSTLQSFRRGSFAMAKKHKLKITGMIMHGCADCWAKAAPMGGDPAIVTVSLFDVMDLAKESDDIEVGEIAERCQVIMEKELQELNALAAKRSGGKKQN